MTEVSSSRQTAGVTRSQPSGRSSGASAMAPTLTQHTFTSEKRRSKHKRTRHKRGGTGQRRCARSHSWVVAFLNFVYHFLDRAPNLPPSQSHYLLTGPALLRPYSEPLSLCNWS